MDRTSSFPNPDFEGLAYEIWLGLNDCLYHAVYVRIYANTIAMHLAGSRRRHLKLLGIKQQFILTENIAALSEIHLRNDYPKLMKGILLSAEESLQTGFDVDAFMEGCKQNPDRRSPFLP